MDLSNEDNLVIKYQNKDKNAENILLNRYQNFIKRWISEFNNLRNMDLEQLWFKGLVAFYNAMQTYDLEKGHFYSFCKTCCKRVMMTELKKQQNRLKYETPVPIEDLSHYMFMHEKDDDEEIDILKNMQVKGDISELEKQILELRSHGDSYKVISTKLNLSQKKIDNVIQAIKRRFKDK